MSAVDRKSRAKKPVRKPSSKRPKAAKSQTKVKGSMRAKMASHSSDLRDQVVGTLRDNNGPMETLAIAQSLGMRTRKQINPTLYKMQQQGTIVKVSESPPKWGLKHEVTLGHESQARGQSSPLHNQASAIDQCGAEEQELSLSSEEMPSLEYAGDCVPDDVHGSCATDGNYNEHTSGVPQLRSESEQYGYPHNERMVQYKASPPRDNPQGPLHYGEAPAAVSTQADSISEMGTGQGMRGNHSDSYSALESSDVQASPIPCSSSSSDDMESLDQQDGARNGFPNVPTMAEAVEFLQPSVARPENRNSLNYKLLSTLCTMKEPIHSNELAKLVGLRSKKEINPTLFGMQKQALVHKVNESPPLWIVTTFGRNTMLNGDTPNHMHQTQRQFSKSQGCFAESSVPSQRNPFQPQYLQQQQHQHQHQHQHQQKFHTSLHRNARNPAPNNGSQAWQFQGPPPPPAMLLQSYEGRFPANTNFPRNQRGDANQLGQTDDSNEWMATNQETQQRELGAPNWKIPPLPPNSEFEPCQEQAQHQVSSYKNRGAPQLSNTDQVNQILIAMSSGKTYTTVDIAHAVGCKASKEVNPTVYAMNRNKLLERVQEAPPIWRLSQAGKDQARNILSSEMSQGLPPNPQELIQKTSGWRAGNSSGIHQPHVVNAYTLSPRVGSESQATLPSHSAAGPTFNAAGPPHNAAVTSHNAAGTSVSSEMFGAINKNPISALTEYAQSRHLSVAIDMLHQHGPPHNPRFTFCAKVGSRSFQQITSRSKKDGRREAADVALRTLIAEGNYQPKMSTVSLETTPSSSTTFYDRIAGLSHQAFNSIAANIPDNISGRKVLAALIMKRGEADEGTVISLGTGNRCVTGDMLSLEGGTVNDSHAEIITRRAFLRYLYNQLAEFKQNPDHTILSETSPGRFRVRQGVTFHLYISTAPCGDGAQFSRTDAGENAEGPEGLEFNGQAQHLPTFGKNIQGLLRTKMEYGEGTIPVDSSHPVQTWDGIIRGERLRTMSCSDKVARWNILGLQGALLSHFIEPIYLSSLTLGSLYHHGHLSRAVCCRLSHSLETQELTSTLTTPYHINHPQLGCVTAFDPPRGTEKTKALSINWFVECAGPEVTDGTKGRVQGVVPSQLCKSTLFAEFQRIVQLYGRDDLQQARTYHEAKGMAKEFEAAKKYMKEAFKKGGYGVWIEKPVEEELFAL